MQQQRQAQTSSLMGALAVSALLIWAAWESMALQAAFPFLQYLLGFCALVVSARAAGLLLVRLHNFLLRREAMRATTQKGSASWSTKQDMKRAGLYEPDNGLFLGCDTRGAPLFFAGETHGLTLAPAGSGKTVAFAIPALCHSPLSMIISDFKGTLSVMTHALRKKHHNHEVFCINPAHCYTQQLGIPTRYNPVQILVDDWLSQERNKDLLADAQSMALQLYPEPAGTGENTFWRNGSRKIPVFDAGLSHHLLRC